MKKEILFSGYGCIYNSRYKWRDVKKIPLAFDFFDLWINPLVKTFIDPTGMVFYIAEIPDLN